LGSAKAGTPLMQADQAIGIDLPMKVLVYENEAGKAWLAYTDPSWLARHGLGAAVAPNVDAMAAALDAVATELRAALLKSLSAADFDWARPCRDDRGRPLIRFKGRGQPR
jgi:hypothetical protein